MCSNEACCESCRTSDGRSRPGRCFPITDLNTVKELKALKEENAKLKKLVTDLSLDKVALKELLEGKW